MNLNELDLSEYDNYLADSVKSDFYNVAGKEHYILLNHLCKGKDLVIDIGTYRGASAVAMSSAKEVITWDVENLLECKLPSNVKSYIGNCLNNKLFDADIILLDTYHNGDFEYDFYNFIVYGFKGLLIIDDIHLNEPMEKFWKSIKERKEDVTNIGHYTGTGLVYFE